MYILVNTNEKYGILESKNQLGAGSSGHCDVVSSPDEGHVKEGENDKQADYSDVEQPRYVQTPFH